MKHIVTVLSTKPKLEATEGLLDKRKVIDVPN